MTPEQEAKIVAWYRETYMARTEAIEAGNARIDWIVPEYRVTLTETRSYADSIGVTLTVDDVATITARTHKTIEPSNPER